MLEIGIMVWKTEASVRRPAILPRFFFKFIVSNPEIVLFFCGEDPTWV